VHLGGPLETYEELSELVKPREAALDRPAQRAKPRAVVGLAACDGRRDATSAKLFAVRVAVVAAIPHEGVRAAPGPPAASADGRNAVYEREELGDVVDVCRGEDGRERDAGCVGDEVVL
jgi:hypothetical protein